MITLLRIVAVPLVLFVPEAQSIKNVTRVSVFIMSTWYIKAFFTSFLVPFTVVIVTRVYVNL